MHYFEPEGVVFSGTGGACPCNIGICVEFEAIIEEHIRIIDNISLDWDIIINSILT